MAKNTHILILLLALCCWCSSVGQSVLIENYPVIGEVFDLRLKLVKVAESQVGVTELTGKNDGPEVAMYLAVVGLLEGYPYCAAGMAWCHEQLNIPNPKSAWSPDWFRANVVYRKNHVRIQPFVSRPGQVFGLYYESKKRVAHVGMITSSGKLHYFTTEFNTNGSGSNEGQGVRNLLRRKESIYVIADHVGAEEIRKGLKL